MILLFISSQGDSGIPGMPGTPGVKGDVVRITDEIHASLNNQYFISFTQETNENLNYRSNHFLVHFYCCLFVCLFYLGRTWGSWAARTKGNTGT